MATLFGDAPHLVAHSADGTPIAVFAGGSGQGRPVLLVHGTGSDHTTWRVLAPLLADARPVYAMDRRGRGASGDGPAYGARYEAEDVAVASELIARSSGRGIAVLGHSLGGRIALAASRLTASIERIVALEGAPSPRSLPGGPADDERLLAVLAGYLAAGDRDAVLEAFMREAAGLTGAELAAFQSSELWAIRARTAPQIVRELDAALHDPAIGIDRLAGVRVPVLQLAGGASPARFRDGVVELDRRLTHGRVEIVAGAGHNMHHTHAPMVAAAARGDLDA